MRDASDLPLKSKDPSDDTVIDTAISCDGIWQKRGYSSLNGVISVITIDNGKILGNEPMTQICESCFVREKLKTSDERRFEECKLTHV